MSTKALSVLELWHIIVLTWYLTYYPKQYAEVIGVENIWEGDT
jgi:aspartyl/asparaginyl beta-hydroxylase (cupin superfamily)